MSSVVVEIDHLHKGLKATVVHVGRGIGNVSKGWRFKFTQVVWVPRYSTQTGVRSDGVKPVVGELIVGK